MKSSIWVRIISLTDSPHMPQTKAKKAKSLIFMKVGLIDQLMGGVDRVKYFVPEVTLTDFENPP